MPAIATNALQGKLRTFLPLRKSRLETFCALVLGVLISRTVNLSHLAALLPNRAQVGSNYRRLQRFLEQVSLDFKEIARFMVTCSGLNEGRWRLTMDRTNWKLGRLDVNILMLGIVHQGVAIPLLWSMLDKRGNSNTSERINLLKRFLALFGAERIISLLADREFIGDAWLAWLHRHGISFHIRIRANIHITNSLGRPVKAGELLRDLKVGGRRILRGKRRLGDGKKRTAPPLFVAATRLKTGELLIVVTNAKPDDALDQYAKRWEIETLFAAYKTRGFNLEDTHLVDPERIAKILAVLAVAFCWAHAVGEWKNAHKPIPIKKHGRRAASIFRHGLDELRRVLFQIFLFPSRNLRLPWGCQIFPPCPPRTA